MDWLRRTFHRYTGFLRGLKIVYVINNLLNYKRLRHNKALYRRYGLKKSVFSPIRSAHFTGSQDDLPWLDQPSAKQRLEAHHQFNSFDDATRSEIRRFVDDGFMILRGFFSQSEVDRHIDELDRLQQTKAVDFNYTGRKIMEAYRHSDFVDTHFFRNERLLRILNFVMGKAILPFHTIHFFEGSEQKAHSDSIHMTTEPPGYLIAAWIALESTDANNGPLFYYPGSHQLPYIMSDDYQSDQSAWRLGADSYRNYETHVGRIIESQGLEKVHFFAQAGDVLIWHANLLHGGEAIREKGRTRRSMVAHYFCEDVICYHEITQRPALIDR